MPLLGYQNKSSEYSFYYYATDLRANVFAGQTELKMIDFSLGMALFPNKGFLIVACAGSVIIIFITIIFIVN